MQIFSRPFGDAIRAARIERGYTQKQLAEMIDVDERSISNIEKYQEKKSLDKELTTLKEKEEEAKKAEQKLSLIKEMLNQYQDPGDRLDKMVELQIQVNKLLEENATIKQKLQQAYEFMKSKFLNGVNMFEEFAIRTLHNPITGNSRDYRQLPNSHRIGGIILSTSRVMVISFPFAAFVQQDAKQRATTIECNKHFIASLSTF